MPMNSGIQRHDVAALLEDTQTSHFLTGQPLLLRRGQPGAVVMSCNGNEFEVEFSGRDGRASAVLPLAVDKLMVVRDRPELAAA